MQRQARNLRHATQGDGAERPIANAHREYPVTLRKAPTGELAAGFWIWEVKDMDEAVEWVKRRLNPMPGPSEIEIRPLFDAANFEDALTPELGEQLPAA